MTAGSTEKFAVVSSPSKAHAANVTTVSLPLMSPMPTPQTAYSGLPTPERAPSPTFGEYASNL